MVDTPRQEQSEIPSVDQSLPAEARTLRVRLNTSVTPSIAALSAFFAANHFRI